MTSLKEMILTLTPQVGTQTVVSKDEWYYVDFNLKENLKENGDIRIKFKDVYHGGSDYYTLTKDIEKYRLEADREMVGGVAEALTIDLSNFGIQFDLDLA